MAYVSPALNVMMAAARKAARPLTRDFGELARREIEQDGARLRQLAECAHAPSGFERDPVLARASFERARDRRRRAGGE